MVHRLQNLAFIITMLVRSAVASFVSSSISNKFFCRTCVGRSAKVSVRRQVGTLTLEIATPEDMEDLGALLSVGTTSGDIILMDGDLGAGKTCFSRGFVRARSGLPDMRVTSPTYLLCNTYPVPGENESETLEVHHMDLYRLSGKEDLLPLNLDEVFRSGISLVEWPSRLGSKSPQEYLDIRLSIVGTMQDGIEDSCARHVNLQPHGGRWQQRLEWLLEEGYVDDLVVTSEPN